METLQLDLPGNDPRLGLCTMARGLIGSEILRIGAEIRAAQARGDKICNLTVGDFSSKEFPIPAALREGVLRALAAGETNYPPSDGVLRLREAVREFYRTRLHLDVPLEATVIAGGSRPVRCCFGTRTATCRRRSSSWRRRVCGDSPTRAARRSTSRCEASTASSTSLRRTPRTTSA